MKSKAVLQTMLTLLLLTSMLTLASNIQLTKASDTIYIRVNGKVDPDTAPIQRDKDLYTFTVSETTSWIGYSLDGQMNVTITGNITLSGLSEGSHSLIVYANDTAGNVGHSDSVYFGTEAQQAGPFSMWIVAACLCAVVIAILVGVAVLFYLRPQIFRRRG
jgi:hypothetical protein